jgi:hypothetical protein
MKRVVSLPSTARGQHPRAVFVSGQHANRLFFVSVNAAERIALQDSVVKFRLGLDPCSAAALLIS